MEIYMTTDANEMMNEGLVKLFFVLGVCDLFISIILFLGVTMKGSDISTPLLAIMLFFFMSGILGVLIGVFAKPKTRDTSVEIE